jgi:hypothetical protein
MGQYLQKKFSEVVGEVVQVFNHLNLAALTLQYSIDCIYEREMKLLLDRKSEGKLPTSTRETIVGEFHSLSNILNIGIRSGDKQSEDVLTIDTINNIRRDFKTECPVLADIVASLFPESQDSNQKSNCAVHALSLLLSVRNQSLKNDISMMFTILLVSYGTGCRMINTLKKCGLTVDWDTLSNFLESQLKGKISSVKMLTPDDMPLILLMDNINIFRANKQHHRLFKDYGDSMWNFTVRGAVRPCINCLEKLFSSKETASDSQHDVKKFTFDNIILENNPDHLHIWNAHLDCYFVNTSKRWTYTEYRNVIERHI